MRGHVRMIVRGPDGAECRIEMIGENAAELSDAVARHVEEDCTLGSETDRAFGNWIAPEWPTTELVAVPPILRPAHTLTAGEL